MKLFRKIDFFLNDGFPQTGERTGKIKFCDIVHILSIIEMFGKQINNIDLFAKQFNNALKFRK